MSLEDMFETISNLTERTRGEEENLQEKEKTETKYLTHLSNESENLTQDQIEESVSVFLEETKLANDIAENLVHLDEKDAKLRKFLEERSGKVANKISKFEESTEDIETLAKYFLDEMSELQNEGETLKQIVNSRDSPAIKEKFRKAEKNIEKAEILAENISSEDSITRRSLLKAGAAAGLTSGAAGYLLGKSQGEKNSGKEVYPRGVEASAEIFDEYLDRKNQLTEKKSVDINLPIALGERHKPPGNTFPILLRLMKKYNPNKLGLEFLTQESSSIKEFNSGKMTPSEMTKHYLDKPVGWSRINEQVFEVFQYAKKENVKIIGLEYTSGIEHYSDENTYERFKKMADIVENANDGDSIFVAGSQHVDKRMHIMGNLLKNAHPKVAKNITVEESMADPHLYRKFDEDIGVPGESLSPGPGQSAAIFEFAEKYTFKGRVNSFDSIASTHAAEQMMELKKSLAWLEETAIDEYELIEDKINKIKADIEEMSSKASYTTVSKSGYDVFVEPNPPSKYL
jgi:hypothetical protein